MTMSVQGLFNFSIFSIQRRKMRNNENKVTSSFPVSFGILLTGLRFPGAGSYVLTKLRHSVPRLAHHYCEYLSFQLSQDDFWQPWLFFHSFSTHPTWSIQFYHELPLQTILSHQMKKSRKNRRHVCKNARLHYWRFCHTEEHFEGVQ